VYIFRSKYNHVLTFWVDNFLYVSSKDYVPETFLLWNRSLKLCGADVISESEDVQAATVV
jgi:hypothetical protein